MRDLAAEGRTMLVVTHEMGFAREAANKLLFLHQGRVEDEGDPREVMANPKSERFRQFLVRQPQVSDGRGKGGCSASREDDHEKDRSLRLRHSGSASRALALPAAAQEKIKIGTEAAYKPFAWVLPSGELTGFDIDIAKALCAQMRRECEIVNQSFDGLIPALKAKKIDAIIASMSITPERRRRSTSPGPTTTVPALFIAAKDSGIELTADGLTGKTSACSAARRWPTTSPRTSPSARIAALRHLGRRQPRPRQRAGRPRLRRLGGAAGLPRDAGRRGVRRGRRAGLRPEVPRQGAGIGLRKGDDELKQKFNDALAAIIASGEYKTINDKYIPVEHPAEVSRDEGQRGLNGESWSPTCRCCCRACG